MAYENSRKLDAEMHNRLIKALISLEPVEIIELSSVNNPLISTPYYYRRHTNNIKCIFFNFILKC